MHRPSLLPLGLALLIAGCGPGSIDAPSLQSRPIERLPIAPPDEVAEPETPAAPGLAAMLDALVAKGEAAHRTFMQDRARANEAALRARSAPEGSEAWVQAQQSLSGLEAERGAVRDVATEIDALRADPAHYGSGSRAAIDAAAARIRALAEAEAGT